MPIINSTLLPVYTWATKPTAAQIPIGKEIFISDVGINGSVWKSNGTELSPNSCVTLYSSAEVPCGLPPSSTIGANGALTLGTAVEITYPKIYWYFGAGQVYSGSPAGLYYTVMSSPTVGTVYNNLYTGGIPSVPASLTPIVDAGPGAFTQTINTDFTLASFPIPAGVMGTAGSIRPSFMMSVPSNANSKSPKVFCDTANIYTAGVTTSKSLISVELRFKNRGQNNSQISSCINSASGISTSPSALTYSSIDTSAIFNVTYTGRLTTATDFVIFNAFFIYLEY